MKYLLFLALSLVSISCKESASHHTLSNNEKIAIEKGKEAAKTVIDADQGMEQEKALLRIRARQHEIALAGDSAAARAFATSAKASLDSANILK